MASASSLLYEEQLLCSICLSVFNEPVSTPCGHNYCKSCITGYWDSSGLAHCPLCNERFSRRPQLQVNTEFRDMVDHFNGLRVNGDDGVVAKPGEVSCDICTTPKLKALKTCLVCLASYCQPHLVPHRSLKKHKLVDPVSNLEDRVCKKHDKLLELFCYVDEEGVCLMCLKDDHVGHTAVPIEQAFQERKVMVQFMMSHMKALENTKSVTVNEMRCSLQQSKETSDSHIAEIDEVFTALVASLQRRQREVTELIQEKQKAAEREAEDDVAQMEREAAELKWRISAMEQILQKEDQLYLLRNCPSLSLPQYLYSPRPQQFDSNLPFTGDLPNVSPQVYVEIVKRSVEQIEKTLSNDMETLIHRVRLSDGQDAGESMVKEAWSPPQDRLMMIQQCDAVNVTLDAYTANNKLVVSEDGKQVTFRKSRMFLPTLFGRKFECLPLVLAKDGYSSGRFYYEVQVSGCKMWLLGVVKESINRETLFCPMNQNGAWVFYGFCDQFAELYCPNTPHAMPYLKQRLQTVGVFVDYEKGEISFYDVEARTLMYSFTGCTFTETATGLQAFLYTMAGASCSSRPKLYPVFGMYREHSDDTLIIKPVGGAPQLNRE